MKRLDIEQRSPEWYQARSGIPTASEFGRFITPKRGDLSAQATGYIADLIVETVEGSSEGMSSYYMDRGSLLEDEARSWYEFKYGCEIEQTGLILNKGAGWSPDGLVCPGAIEIKCPKPSTHVTWLLDGGLPDAHRPQCHGALYVGELEWLDFVSYCPGYKTLVVKITPDDYTTKVATALSKFLERLDEAKSRILK